MHIGDRAVDQLRMLEQQAECGLRIQQLEHQLSIRRREDELDLRIRRRQADHDLAYMLRADALWLRQREFELQRDCDLHRLQVARERAAVVRECAAAARRVLFVIASAIALYALSTSGIEPRDLLNFIEALAEGQDR